MLIRFRTFVRDVTIPGCGVVPNDDANGPGGWSRCFMIADVAPAMLSEIAKMIEPCPSRVDSAVVRAAASGRSWSEEFSEAWPAYQLRELRHVDVRRGDRWQSLEAYLGG